MGSSADIPMGIFGAVIIGTLAGAVSTLGYIWLQDVVLSKFNVHDTCGVHNLHGMPGVMGCIFSIVFGTAVKPDGFSVSAQVCTLLLTLVVAILGGAITGFVMKAVVDKSE